jgi:hypothetical protein
VANEVARKAKTSAKVSSILEALDCTAMKLLILRKLRSERRTDSAAASRLERGVAPRRAAVRKR